MINLRGLKLSYLNKIKAITCQRIMFHEAFFLFFILKIKRVVVKNLLLLPKYLTKLIVVKKVKIKVLEFQIGKLHVE